MSKTAEDYAREAAVTATVLAKMKRAEETAIQRFRALGFDWGGAGTTPKLDPAVVVSPEMIEAGLIFLYSFDREWGVDTGEEIVEKIYRAMSSLATARTSDAA